MNPERWTRLKDLFDEASALSPDDRVAMLERVQSEDLDLLAGLVEMIEAHEEAGSFLESPLMESLGLERPLLAQGDVLANRFRIEERIGKGGMGEVYRAFDTQLNDWVAVKTLRPEYATQPAFLQRLTKELQLARRVSHRNVCRSYDIMRGEAESGKSVVFVTMELLRGCTLASVLRGKAFTPETAKPIAVQLAEGLDAAHRAGIVHRDFKSANVMLVDCDEGQRVAITDFGLAREQKADGNETLTVFSQGSFAGTPSYMAPELFQGGPATPKSDIYALGVVLYEMLTGSLPFKGDTPVAIALNAVQHAPTSPRKLLPHLDSRWEAAVMACLSKDPAMRPSSGAEVLAIIQGTRGRSRDPNVTRRVAIGACVVAGVAGAFLITRPSRRSPEALRHYRLGEEFGSRRTPAAMKNAVEEYQKAVKVDPTYAEAWAGLADCLSASANFGFGDTKTALADARTAAMKAVDINPGLSRAQGVLGYTISMDTREWRKAESYFQRAVELDPSQPSVRLWYGAWLGKIRRVNESIAQLKAGLQENPSNFHLNHQLSFAYFIARQFDEFLQQSRELIRIFPHDANAYLMLGRAQEWHGLYAEALTSCDSAMMYGVNLSGYCFRAVIEAARGNANLASMMAVEVEKRRAAEGLELPPLVYLHCRLRNIEKAMELLEKAWAENDGTMLVVPVTPYADLLRDHPRFGDLMKRLGF